MHFVPMREHEHQAHAASIVDVTTANGDEPKMVAGNPRVLEYVQLYLSIVVMVLLWSLL